MSIGCREIDHLLMKGGLALGGDSAVLGVLRRGDKPAPSQKVSGDSHHTPSISASGGVATHDYGIGLGSCPYVACGSRGSLRTTPCFSIRVPGKGSRSYYYFSKACAQAGPGTI
ncbi:hypothetical protein BHE74_00049420 [Ensete ventricosum]|nr:hypothetical protein BHE74_00049420 [Ensete ventricosum]